MTRNILIATLSVMLLGALPAAAEFYAGVGIGNSFIGQEVTDAANEVKDIDENSTGFKFFAGSATGSIFGFEGGYRNLGKVDSAVDNAGTPQTYSYQTTGWDADALARLRLGPVDVFGKAGLFLWKTKTWVGDTLGEDDGLALLWGAGVGVRLGKVGFRLEWESMEVKSPDSLSLVSLGLTLGF